MQPADLVAAAVGAMKCAYAPYSRFLVGAAVLTASGEVVTGCNVENASFGLTLCAERNAIFAAVARGHRGFVALAIATEPGSPPCGACRQVLREFASDLTIHLANAKGEYRTTSLAALLPDSFGSDSLGG